MKEKPQRRRLLRDRVPGRLSKNKRVTALALAIYDPDLPEPLEAALRTVNSDAEREDEGRAAQDKKLTSELIEDLGRLRGDQDRTARKIEAVEQTLRERGFKPDLVTPSDAEWERWMAR